MMITRSALAIIFLLVCLSGAGALCQDKTPPQQPPLLTFTDLERNGVGEQAFRIVGYVIDIYKCPPCPPGAMCKPCIPDNIVVTDNVEEEDLSKVKRLRIYADEPEQFEVKKKYLFNVKLKGSLPPGSAITDVELVSFEAIKK
jgi:hypothetical protein